MPWCFSSDLTTKTAPADLVGGAAIDGLKERRSLENVNRLRDLRLDERPFARRHPGLVFAGFVIYSGLALLILILIYQKIPPRMSQTISQVRFAEANYGSASTFT
jgi:hypothetical protein